MASPSPSEVSVRDPLSKVTRTERRYLLAMSIIGITLVKTGLVPSKISALGIEFGAADQKSMLGIFGLVILYFLVAFIIYAAADFVTWRLSHAAAIREGWLPRPKKTDETDNEYRKELERTALYLQHFEYKLSLLAHPILLFRSALEFVLPVIVGVYAIVKLWTAPAPIQESPKTASPVVIISNIDDASLAPRMGTNQITRQRICRIQSSLEDLFVAKPFFGEASGEIR